MILPILALFSSICLLICKADRAGQYKYLLSETFEGSWRLIISGNASAVDPWPEMEGKEGIAIISFEKEDQKEESVQSASLELLMPRYKDQKVLKLNVELSKYYKTQSETWSGLQNSTYYLYNSSRQVSSGHSLLQFTLDESLIGIKIDDETTIVISYAPRYMSSLTSFSFSFGAFLVFMAIRRKNQASDTRITHHIIPLILSTVMTFLVSVSEILIGFGSLFGKMSPQAFFTVAGIINLAVCYQVIRFYWSMVFLSRWSIILVWVLGCAYLWFLLFFRHESVCLIVNSLIFLPEIGYHCLRGRKIESDLRFILFGLSGQVYVMYYKSCPANIFKQSPTYLVAYCVSSLLIAQTVILLGQYYIGSRFFIPSLLLPSYYNYYDIKNIKLAVRASIECHICLEEIKIEEAKKEKAMVTPCRHVFHADCLEKWMLVHMTCPVDRSALPPV